MRKILAWIALPFRHHFIGSFFIVVASLFVMSMQISDRMYFANSELYNAVADRWGEGLRQPEPSLRYVPSGAVFHELHRLSFSRQDVSIHSKMNYRKRGLVYFSGFNFTFDGHYRAVNPESQSIDAVFIFPLAAKNRLMVSDLAFTVDGKPVAAVLDEKSDRFVWTGRLKARQAVAFTVSFVGRGMQQILYLLDPQLPVRDFHMQLIIDGGDNFDYPSGVSPATGVRQDEQQVHLDWKFTSLEAGVPLGVLMPSEKAYDQIIATMLSRAWLPFVALFVGLTLLAKYHQTRFRFYQAYLIAANYALSFVLLAYSAAFFDFYWAFFLSVLISGGLMWAYVWQALQRRGGYLLSGLLAAFWLLPCIAVIVQGYTGLIYTMGAVASMASLMMITSHAAFRSLLDPNPAQATNEDQPSTGSIL